MSRLALFYADEVETDIIERYSFFHAKMLDRKKKRTTLVFCEGFFRRSEKITRSEFDLDEYGGGVFFCHDIYLSTLDGVVRIDDRVVMFLEIFYGNNLSGISSFSSIFHVSTKGKNIRIILH